MLLGIQILDYKIYNKMMGMTQKSKESFSQGTLFMVLSALGLAFTGLLGKIGLNRFSLVPLLFWRYVATFFFTFLMVLWMGSFKQGIRIQHFPLHLFRACLVIATQYFYYFYLETNTIFNAVVLLNTAPLFIPIIERIVLKQKIGVSTQISLAISFPGMLLILQPDTQMFSETMWIGLLAGIAQGASQVVFGISSKTERSDLSLFYLSFLCLIITAIPLPFASSKDLITPFTTHPLLYEIILGLGLATLFNQFFRSMAYWHSTPSKLSPFLYTSVIFAGIWDWLFFNNVPNLLSIIGAGLVILGGIAKVYFRAKILRRNTTYKK